jgi:hypothetical protein
VHGQSGGPVVNDDGEVVALIQQSNMGLSYGIPALAIRAFLYDALGVSF